MQLWRGGDGPTQERGCGRMVALSLVGLYARHHMVLLVRDPPLSLPHLILDVVAFLLELSPCWMLIALMLLLLIF